MIIYIQHKDHSFPINKCTLIDSRQNSLNPEYMVLDIWNSIESFGVLTLNVRFLNCISLRNYFQDWHLDYVMIIQLCSFSTLSATFLGLPGKHREVRKLFCTDSIVVMPIGIFLNTYWLQIEKWGSDLFFDAWFFCLPLAFDQSSANSIYSLNIRVCLLLKIQSCWHLHSNHY